MFLGTGMCMLFSRFFMDSCKFHSHSEIIDVTPYPRSGLQAIMGLS